VASSEKSTPSLARRNRACSESTRSCDIPLRTYRYGKVQF
jgi:hypothetical protein